MQIDWVVKKRDPNLFFRVIRSIHDDHANLLCKDLGKSVDYWRDIVADAGEPNGRLSHVVRCFDDSKSVKGFALIKEGKQCLDNLERSHGRANCVYGNPHSWYIETICTSKGYGHKLMDVIHTAAKSNHIHYISLSALCDVILFYHKLGYRMTLDLSCHEDEKISAIAEKLRAEHKVFSSVEEALDNEDFIKMVKLAISKKLSTVRNLDGSCIDVEDCVEDGIYMQLCLNKKTMELIPTDDESETLREAFKHPLNIPAGPVEFSPDMEMDEDDDGDDDDDEHDEDESKQLKQIFQKPINLPTEFTEFEMDDE